MLWRAATAALPLASLVARTAFYDRRATALGERTYATSVHWLRSQAVDA